MAAFGEYSDDGTASAMKARDCKGATARVCAHGTQDPCVNEHIAFAFGRNNGGENAIAFNPNQGGMGLSEIAPPIVPAYGLPGNWIGRSPENGGNAVEPMVDVSPCLTKTDVHAVAFSAGNSAGSRGVGYTEEGTPPLRSGASGTNQVPTIATFGEVARPLTARHDSSPCADRGMDIVAFTANDYGNDASQDLVPTMRSLSCGADGSQSGGHGLVVESQVRRLTPIECARLQGFPDNYLDIQFKGKPATDGYKYKALGNSFAVPVVRWIGKRIADALIDPLVL